MEATPAVPPEVEKQFAASQPTLVEKDGPVAKPKKLSELDKLKLENVSLKLMAIGQQFEKLSTERTRFSQAFDDLRKECLDRYGVDVTTTRIDDEGTFCGPLAPPQRA